MSRSYKKAIYKDVGHRKKGYWRTIRRVQKQAIKQGKDIPNPKTIINDHDYSDYTIDYEHNPSVYNFWTQEDNLFMINKLSKK